MAVLQFIGGFVKRVLAAFAVETLSPLSPSPCQVEGELSERGLSPLLNTPLLEFVYNPLSKGSFRGTQPLLTTPF
ncbi:MAG: hypothetical protein MUO90_02735, partial [Dehalococcoidales bacterium]|nr:hypothetical protein [Dehalococcoidales bacterium]